VNTIIQAGQMIRELKISGCEAAGGHSWLALEEDKCVK